MPPVLQRRRGALDICGDPLCDETFREDLQRRCRNNDWPKVKVRQGLFLRGSGLFAKSPIRRGEYVCEYAGVLIPNSAYDRMLAAAVEADPSKVAQIEEYAVGGRTHTILGHNEAVEGRPMLKNSFGRLVNHSRMHANLKAPQFLNLAPNGTAEEDWHAVFQVQL